jgi:4-deoxy-L-threo-5-hexosulose-uronate ketol-isomerase
MKKSILTLLLCLIAGWGMAQNAYTHYEVRWASNPRDAKHYDTKRLRKEFLIEKGLCAGRGKLDLFAL